jgi:acyl-CoA thioester hydrolase
VRSTDCDAAGHVGQAVYLRYMQEAAFEGSADAGYGPARYTEMGVTWLIRRSRIDYLHPLRYGDAIDVTTYVADFRRVRSQRNYEMVRSSDGAMAAFAATDWAFLNARSGAPTRIPDELMVAFRPEGPDPNPATRIDATRLPDDPPSNAFHAAQRVHFYDLDQNQHVNNAVYLNYLEQATIDANAAAGFDISQLIEQGGFFVVRQHDIEYLRPAQYGDTLDIATWISEVAHASALRHATMRIQGELAIRAQTRWVWIDLKTRRPAAMPAAVREALAAQRVKRET